MLKQFEPFYNKWCSFESVDNGVTPELFFHLELNSKFFNGLKFDPESLKEYRVQAAKRCSEMLGDRPVLCLSGGVDSQAMIQCWQEAGLDFDVAILVFDRELNRQDVDHARLYCSVNNITPVEIPLNIATFLTIENYDYGLKYKCSSPHFNTHYKMFNVLREMGYTGVCAGGVYPYVLSKKWVNPLSMASINFVEYSRVTDYPAMGNFLGYSPELAWTLGMLSFVDPDVLLNDPAQHRASVTMQERNQMADVRYADKIASMTRHGFNIIPQSQKFTGFELVKDYFAEKAGGDGWAFERNFRHPLEELFPECGPSIMTIPASTKKTMDRLHNNQLLASQGAGPGVANQLCASDNSPRRFYTRCNP